MDVTLRWTRSIASLRYTGTVEQNGTLRWNTQVRA